MVMGAKQQKAFEESKVLLQSGTVLVLYDSNKPLILACDASPWGRELCCLTPVMLGGYGRWLGQANRVCFKDSQFC